MEVLLTKHNSDIPFVTKKGEKYFIENVEYTDDINILLNAIKNVKPIDYQSMFVKDEKETKETYWQRHFNHQWTAGGMILWHNPTEMYNQELTRQGILRCPECGGKMVMYYRSYCPVCEGKPKKDKKGRYMLFEIFNYLSAKHNIPEQEINDAILDPDIFEYSNDTVIDLYIPDGASDECKKYLKMIDEEWLLETTNFFVSW